MNGRAILFILFVILIPAGIQAGILTGYKDIAADVIDDSKYLSSLAADMPTAGEIKEDEDAISFSRGAVNTEIRITASQIAKNYKKRIDRDKEALHTQKFLSRLPVTIWPIFFAITFVGYLVYVFASGGTGIAGFGQRIGAAILGSIIFFLVDTSIATLVFSVIIKFT